MHELALAQQMVDMLGRLAAEHGASQVRVAVLRLGQLTCIDPQTLSFAFEVAGRGTLLEGCRLEIRRVPLALRCPVCGWEGRDSDGGRGESRRRESGEREGERREGRQPEAEHGQGGQGWVELVESCPGCGASGMDVIGGREIELDSIDIDE